MVIHLIFDLLVVAGAVVSNYLFRQTYNLQRPASVPGQHQYSYLLVLSHPENLSIGYGLKLAGEIVPVTGMLPREELLRGADNTITFEKSDTLRKAFYKLFSLDACGEQTSDNLQTMLCCLPKIEGTQDLSYEHVFRVVIMSFMDKYDFDIGSIKRSCTHFVEPNGKIYPFETWNMFYRDKIRNGSDL